MAPITGFVQLSSGDNSIVNNGAFNLRHFADTDGDGVRDTLRVAVSDLGTGTSNSFTNAGTLALSPVSGATRLDSTGEYLPLGNAANAVVIGGPLQGQFLGVANFNNSGTIDLQANPAAGDVLVISGGRSPGAAGTGTFVSDGGVLRVDTMLNAGGSGSHSDVLVVDGTGLGQGGPTQLAVRHAGGLGAVTTGDGILVVEVLDSGRSAAGAFSLTGAPVVAGPYEYLLFNGGANSADWFLRSTLSCSAEGAPSPPCPTPTPTPT